MVSPRQTSYRVEPGSFRDREGRVFYHEGVVYRGLSQTALDAWRLLAAQPFFQRLTAEGKLVGTESVPAEAAAALPEAERWAGVVRHETISVISYPYEWSFTMLKDAARLQLEILLAALEADMTLKDASAFNVQWRGQQPVFIDIPSLEPLRPGEPWAGYRQFCQLFLYPLMLQAYKDVAFHAWLRGRLDGIEPEEFSRLLGARDLLRPGVFTHAYLQGKMQSRYSDTRRDIKQELRGAGFRKEMIEANARGLLRLVEGLTWQRSRSTWSEYAHDNSYSDDDHERKAAFVRAAVATGDWRLVWDLGCNTGAFARIAAERARYVVAMDADHLTIDHLYRALKAEGVTTILPLVSNLADPSPRQGWRLLERTSLAERGAPDLVLCLALIHHLVISANIPLAEVIDWLADLGADLVIEFVARDDPMAQRLLRNKIDNYEGYDLPQFEACLAQRYEIVRREELGSGTRTLFFGKNRRPAVEAHG